MPIVTNGRKLAVCDPDAFYPFRRLVEGPLTDPKDLEAAERFVRTVALHDDLVMGLEPLPSDPDLYEAKKEEIRKKAALAASAGAPLSPGVPAGIIVSLTEIGVQEEKAGYGLFSDNLTGKPAPDIELSPDQLEIVSAYSRAEVGNAHYTSHLRYLQHLFGIVRGGGSILCEHPFPRAAIEKATPTRLFEFVDSDWKEYAEKIQSGRLGLVIPPLLSIVLSSCARRDAIPAAVIDLRRDWEGARRKVWELVEDQKKHARSKRATKSSANLSKPPRGFHR